ncbi:MAG: EamA family transporter, partial [Anaerolineae bacterium]|nr:EamA family transporter [Anaerolineae bacterium]
PYEITAWRLGIAALAIMGTGRLRHYPVGPDRTDLCRFLGFGLVAALHFLCYIASLSLTTIAHSLSLVYTSPIFVTIASAWLLHEPIPRRKWAGTLIAVIGVAVLTGLEPYLSRHMILGDLLAVGSAIMYGLYSVAGRSQRARYPLFTYAGTVYGLAALWTLPAAMVAFTPNGYGWRQIGALLSLGVLPSALGHTLYNAALRRTHATYVNLIATQEVTGGVILGMLLLHETPSLNAIVGAVITLAGIALVVV